MRSLCGSMQFGNPSSIPSPIPLSSCISVTPRGSKTTIHYVPAQCSTGKCNLMAIFVLNFAMPWINHLNNVGQGVIFMKTSFKTNVFLFSIKVKFTGPGQIVQLLVSSKCTKVAGLIPVRAHTRSNQ